MQVLICDMSLTAAKCKRQFAENPAHDLPSVAALSPVTCVWGLLGAITSAITEGIGLMRCDRCNFPLVRHVFLAVGIPMGIVGLVLLTKAAFNWLEARTARGPAKKS